MASELERIANRLRYLSSQADQHRATIYSASRGFSETAQAIAHTKYPAPDGVDREPPQQLVGRLTAAARGADRAIGPLATTARLLRDFAASLVSTSVGPIPAPIPSGSGATAEYPPAGARPSAAPGAPVPPSVPAPAPPSVPAPAPHSVPAPAPPSAPTPVPTPVPAPVPTPVSPLASPPSSAPSARPVPAHAAPERSGEDHPSQQGVQGGGRHRAGSIPPAVAPTQH